MIFRGFLASFAAAVVFLMIGALGTPAGAVVTGNCFDADCVVSDGGASILFDANGVTSGDWELNDFFLGGVNHLSEEEWHLCLDSCGSDLNVELDDNFDLAFADADEATNTISVTFLGSGLELTIEHVLEGGPGTATLTETLTLTNLSESAIDVALTEFDDFDLADGSGGDTVTFDDTENVFTQTDGDVTLTLTSTPLNSYNVGLFDDGESDLLGGLVPDGSGDLSIGPADVVFGIGYDIITLAAFESDGDSITITKVKTLSIAQRESVPEPATLTLFGLGLVGLGAMRRRRRSRVASSQKA